MTDLFRVQDEITTAICARLEPRVRVEDIAYGAREGSVSSWRLWQEGWYWLFIDAPQPSPDRSLERFRRAVALEPDYALGHAGLAIALATALLWGGLGRDAMEEAREHAEIASKLLPENPVVLYAMAMISFVGPASLELPLEYIERAVELEPSNPMYQGVRGYLLANLGQAREGVECCLHAMRLSPKDAREPFLCYMLGAAYVANEQYELAIETMTRCRRFSEVDFIWLIIAFSHDQLGERDRALASLKRITAPRPYAFYRWALRESLWLGLPGNAKEAFLPLLETAGSE
jgi:tetratricopeptide (TPR) repeat protein